MYGTRTQKLRSRFEVIGIKLFNLLSEKKIGFSAILVLRAVHLSIVSIGGLHKSSSPNTVYSYLYLPPPSHMSNQSNLSPPRENHQ